MREAKLDIDIHSFAARAQWMIRNGEVELRTKNERDAHRMARVRIVDGHAIQVIIGPLYSQPFIPNIRMRKEGILDEIIFDFRDLSSRIGSSERPYLREADADTPVSG